MSTQRTASRYSRVCITFALLAALSGVSCRSKEQFSAQSCLQEEWHEFVVGHLDRAHQLALEGYERTSSTDPLHTAFLIELARVTVSQANFERALWLLRQQLPAGLSRELLLKHQALLSLALINCNKAAEAKQILADAANTLEQGGLSPELEAARGYLARTEGHYQEAIERYQNALHASEASDDEYVQMRMLINIGSAEILQEHFDKSREFNARALWFAQRLGADAALGKLRGNMGWASLKEGNLLQAEQDFQLAEQDAKKIGMKLDAIQWAIDLGLVKTERGDSDAAEAIYLACLQRALASGYRSQVADTHLSLGALYLERASSKALPHLLEAQKFYSLQGDGQNLSEVRLLKAILEVKYGDPELATPELLSISGDPDALPSQRWQAELELARVAIRKGDSALAHTWFSQAVRTFQQQQCSVEDITSKLPFQENGTELFRSYVEHLIGEGHTDEALMVYDQGRATSLRDCEDKTRRSRVPKALSPPNARMLAKNLQGTLLIYYPLPETTYLWAVSRDRTGFYRLPGRNEIESLVHLHEALVTNSKGDPIGQGDEAGQKLYEILVGPAQAQIKPGEAVYVLADGALSKLNFDTLITRGEHPHFWIEDVTITNAASLRLLDASLAKPVTRRPARFLMLGDPAYPPDGSIDPLPHAAEEVRKVEAHFPPERRTVLTGTSATSAAYEKQDQGQYTNIHIVAHAAPNLTAPLESYVLLAGASDKLYARDVLRYPLKADLVVLSTCYSSGTAPVSGEGVVGLAWAFERAGSRNVIGSLWEVSDDSAPDLMDHMYADIASGMRPAQALRNAKLAALHSGKYNRPYYWAPFQLYSNSGEERTR